MDKLKTGQLGEKLAARHLKKNGYRILERNSHHSHSEIDIIAVNKLYIVFVEVKTRTTDQEMYLYYGSPASAVDRAKQQRILNGARAYLQSTKYSSKQPRFDVIEVFLNKDDLNLIKINHIENAFGIR